MPAIKDKESGERRELTGREKEVIANNIDEARSRRLRKLKIAENRAKTEEIKEFRKNGAEEKEIDEALAELVDKWNAEARSEEENESESEDNAESQGNKKAKISNEISESRHKWEREEAKGTAGSGEKRAGEVRTQARRRRE